MYLNEYPGGAGDGGNAQRALIGEVDVCAAGFGEIVSNQVIRHVEVANTFDGDIQFGIYELQFSPFPEPSTIVLLSIGAITIVVLSWQKSFKARGIFS